METSERLHSVTLPTYTSCSQSGAVVEHHTRWRSRPDRLQAGRSSTSARHRSAIFRASAAVAIVLGTAMRYDIAEVMDPLVHIVAKVRKNALADIK